MQVRMLGPLEVRDKSGGPVAVGGTRLRLLLLRLALDAGRPVPPARLIDAVWGDGAAPVAPPTAPSGHAWPRSARSSRTASGQPPDSAAGLRPANPANALQALVSRLRRALPDDAALTGDALGYTLALDPAQVDAHHFTALARKGRRSLDAGEPEAALALLDEALALWRGPALMDAEGADFARGPAVGLEEHRVTAVEDRYETLLRLGRTAGTAAELEQLVSEHPLRERLYGLLIRALDDTGRRGEALSAYQRARTHLADTLGADPSPELEAVHLTVLRRESSAKTAPAPAPAPPAVTGLPTRLTSFLGRERDVARIGKLLGESRLVTLVGPGGAGKTRLSLEVGSRLPAGTAVRFVELAPVRDPTGVGQAVLAAFNRRETGILDNNPTGDGRAAVDRIVGRIAEGIGEQPTVLLLDNCEHLVAAAADIAERLLAAAPTLRILATTREPLTIGGEVLWPLGPLDLPPEDATATEALTHASVRLFADRAAAVRPDLAVDEANVRAVVDICTRLDGMPLAIELAAARTRSLTPDQIADRLDDRFRLLTGGSRTALPRHQTLRAVVEWSWDLLSEPERAVLQRLSVFAGGASLEAAEDILAGDGVDRADVLDLLSGLVDKSLVEAFGVREPRYRMLETIQAYAAERLADSGGRPDVAGRHARRFRDLAEEADHNIRGRAQKHWLDRLSEEHDNIAVALRHATSTGDADAAIRIVAGLGWYWTIRGNHAEAAAWLGEAVAVPGERPVEEYAVAQMFHMLHALAVGDNSSGMRAAGEARWNSRHLDPATVRPELLLIAPMLAAFRGDTAAAVRELTCISDRGDPWLDALADGLLGHMFVNVGRVEEARRALGRSAAGFEVIGDTWGLTTAMSGLAELYAFTGDPHAAIATSDRVLELVAEMGADEDRAEVMVRRAALYARVGEVDRARADLQAAMGLAEQLSSLVMRAYTHLGMATVARSLGDLAEARRHYSDAQAILPRLTNMAPQVIALMHTGLAQLHLAEGDVAAARAACEEAWRVTRVSIDMPVAGTVVETHAALAVAEGDLPRAALMLGAAKSLRGTVDLSDHDVRRTLDAARAALGEEAYEQFFGEGAALDRDAVFGLLGGGFRTGTLNVGPDGPS